MSIPAICPLSDQTWSMIGLHLKPRHLFKLMITSKSMYMVVNNETYWTRVSAHMVWRDIDAMEICFVDPEKRILPRPPMNLYTMCGLEVGYYQAMNIFLTRIDEMMVKTTEKYNDDWSDFQVLDLKNQTLKILESLHNKPKTKNGITMKRLAQKMTHAVSGENRPTYDFVNDLDDDNYVPVRYKRYLLDKIARHFRQIYDMDANHDLNDLSLALDHFSVCDD